MNNLLKFRSWVGEWKTEYEITASGEIKMIYSEKIIRKNPFNITEPSTGIVSEVPGYRKVIYEGDILDFNGTIGVVRYVNGAYCAVDSNDNIVISASDFSASKVIGQEAIKGF